MSPELVEVVGKESYGGLVGDLTVNVRMSQPWVAEAVSKIMYDPQIVVVGLNCGDRGQHVWRPVPVAPAAEIVAKIVRPPASIWALLYVTLSDRTTRLLRTGGLRRSEHQFRG